MHAHLDNEDPIVMAMLVSSLLEDYLYNQKVGLLLSQRSPRRGPQNTARQGKCLEIPLELVDRL